MAASEHTTRFEELPAELPIFPLNGVLLLPRGRLPLNIFEPRYLAMTRDALAPPRLIGMVQPTDPAGESDADATPPLYGIGCAGRIIAFSESDDGRFVLTLAGVARFRIARELPRRGGYRAVVPDWQDFRADLAPDEHAIDRAGILAALRPYFDGRGLKADWEQVEKTADERLVAMLAMVCPFEPPEKQALLEAPTLADRARVLRGLLEMGARETAPSSETRRH